MEADAEFKQRLAELEKGIKAKPAKKKSPRVVIDKDLEPLASYINDKTTPWSMIPTLPEAFRRDALFSNMLYLETAVVDTARYCVLDNDGAVLLSRNDTIYMVSEPPGEPYYIGRVVEFVIKEKFREIIKQSHTSATVFPAKYFNVKMNWFFRPRDIREKLGIVDPRMLYATLQQDVCPITSYRGKCQVYHKDELEYHMGDANYLYEQPNVFYYEELFDRFHLKYYKIFNTQKLRDTVNPESEYLTILMKKYDFIFCEEDYPMIKMVKKYICGETTENPASLVDNWDQSCQVCRSWCENDTSIKCSACKIHVHLACMKPPLLKKPSTTNIKDLYCFFCNKSVKHTSRGVQNAMAEYNARRLNQLALKRNQRDVSYNKDNILFQYFGKHLILNFDDVLNDNLLLPFPILPSRIGIKYQWDGCNTNIDKWTPAPYNDDDNNARGMDNTITKIWEDTEGKINDDKFDGYKEKCAVILKESADMDPTSCAFLDYILKTLYENSFDTSLAYNTARLNLNRQALNEPDFSPEELKKFESGVTKYGGQLRPVWKMVKTQPMSMIVKYFYKWKKSRRGLEVRGKLEKKKKIEEEKDRELHYKEYGKNAESIQSIKYLDDSSIDTDDISLATDCFKCKFCSVDYSPMWYKVSGGTNDNDISEYLNSKKNNQRPNSRSRRTKLGALCIRCARLWRRYAVKWTPPPDVLRRLVGNDEADFMLCIAELISKKAQDEFILDTSNVHKKLLEYELVLDAELIVRQRAEVYVNPDELTAIRESVMKLHQNLYEKVVSTIDRSIYDIPRMKLELEEYLRKFEDQEQLISQSLDNKNTNSNSDSYLESSDAGNFSGLKIVSTESSEADMDDSSSDNDEIESEEKSTDNLIPVKREHNEDITNDSKKLQTQPISGQ